MVISWNLLVLQGHFESLYEVLYVQQLPPWAKGLKIFSSFFKNQHHSTHYLFGLVSPLNGFLKWFDANWDNERLFERCKSDCLGMVCWCWLLRKLHLKIVSLPSLGSRCNSVSTFCLFYIETNQSVETLSCCGFSLDKLADGQGSLVSIYSLVSCQCRSQSRHVYLLAFCFLSFQFVLVPLLVCVSHVCYLHVLCPPTKKCSFALQFLWPDTTKSSHQEQQQTELQTQ